MNSRKKTTSILCYYSHWIFRLPILKNYQAICLGRRIFFKNQKEEISTELFRHEMVHQEQIAAHGFILFYFKYLFAYIRNLWKWRNHHQAYWNIPFEKEAREKSKDTVV